MSAACDRRPVNPSSRLTAASNAAQPALSSHRESIAQAQRVRAAAEAETQRARAVAEAQITLSIPPTPSCLFITPSLTITPPAPACGQSVDLDNHSISGSPPITPTTSQAGSIPSSTDPPSESEKDPDRPSTTALTKGKNKRKKNSGGVLPTHCSKFTFLLILHSGAGDTAQTDKNGMYRDVEVMEIDSDSPDADMKSKNKNAKADINHFFEPVKHFKGDRRGRRQCKSCMSVNQLH